MANGSCRNLPLNGLARRHRRPGGPNRRRLRLGPGRMPWFRHWRIQTGPLYLSMAACHGPVCSIGTQYFVQ